MYYHYLLQICNDHTSLLHHGCRLYQQLDVLFGGISVIMGGDFARTLPVVVHSNRTSTVAASLQRFFIWARLRMLHLRQNMRIQGSIINQQFADWIGRMSYSPALCCSIALPEIIQQFRHFDDLSNHTIQMNYSVELPGDIRPVLLIKQSSQHAMLMLQRSTIQLCSVC